MQLPIYMGVVLDKLKEKYPNSTVHPSAMLYYEMANKFLEVKAAENATEEERLKLSRMEGLLSSDPEDLAANDSSVGLEPGQTKKSSIVPYGIKADGEPSDRDTNAVEKGAMHTVIDYAMLQAAETAKHIIAGDFEPSPARLGSHIDACRYCNYKSVCHFNENEAGYTVRSFEKAKNNSEVVELMKEKLEEE